MGGKWLNGRMCANKIGRLKNKEQFSSICALYVDAIKKGKTTSDTKGASGTEGSKFSHSLSRYFFFQCIRNILVNVSICKKDKTSKRFISIDSAFTFNIFCGEF